MTTAGILDSIDQLQAAVADFLKLADGGDFGVLDDEDFIDAARNSRPSAGNWTPPTTRSWPRCGRASCRMSTWPGPRTGFSSQLWRITVREAGARVREADHLGPRVTMTGEILAAVAAGHRRGPQTRHPQPRPDQGHPGHDGGVARRACPRQRRTRPSRSWSTRRTPSTPQDLARVAQQLIDTINPDGPEPSEHEQQARRHLGLHPARCGMTRIDGLLDPANRSQGRSRARRACPHRSPRTPTGPDPRSPGQRRHDALSQVLDLALHAEELHARRRRPGHRARRR